MSMQTIHQIEDLRRLVGAWRGAGESIALVPTMGNLHDGHLALVRQASGLAERVVVSIFVNPLQFAPGEDFERYPRTLGQDADMLRELGTDCVFAPTEAEVYPRGRDHHTLVRVPVVSEQLEGESRPGFFDGVATVVAKLFGMVQPDLAVFGEKDFQQLQVVRRLVADLCLPIEIHAGPTVREADGLAMSSRNGYLSPEERSLAPRLNEVLHDVAGMLGRGLSIAEATEQGSARLAQAGFRPDYLQVRHARDLSRVERAEGDLVILAAAFLGATRLIDNLPLTLPSTDAVN